VFLSRIRIANFKSLKDVEINSEGLVALVGPNGSGKTNFALAMKFLSEVHQHGLETAIARAGGFENIAYRKGRRTTAPIEFEVEVRFRAELKWASETPAEESKVPLGSFVLSHSFAFKACGAGVRSEFVVGDEKLQLAVKSSPDSVGKLRSRDIVYSYLRNQDGAVSLRIDRDAKRPMKWDKAVLGMFAPNADRTKIKVGKQELLIASPQLRSWFANQISGLLAKLGVFHFSSDKMRDSGVPTPNPALTMPGGNLPALVDWLQRKHPKTWAGILNAMRDIVPDLQEIMVQILPSKTLGLFFSEQGFGRPWGMDEVSDGTIHALSMLVAAADPRTSALVIEELESSLHPWIIYELAKKLRELSKDKSIFLTTQSPIVIDTLKPSEVWIVSRRKGKTEIRRLTELDARIEEDWSKGKYGLSEFLDSGLIPRAVPGGRT
jgi:predicted ATPase